jgi:hypothetical protein
MPHSYRVVPLEPRLECSTTRFEPTGLDFYAVRRSSTPVRPRGGDRKGSRWLSKCQVHIPRRANEHVEPINTSTNKHVEPMKHIVPQHCAKSCPQGELPALAAAP